MKNILIAAFMIVVLTNCASDYPCGEPRIGRCSSVTDNYLKSNKKIINPEDKPINPYQECKAGACNISSDNSWFHSGNNKITTISSNFPQTPSSGSPMVSTPTMMRVWIAPYVDADNIYHEQNYQYMLVDRGKWLFGSNILFGRKKASNQIVPALSQNSNDSFSNINDSQSEHSNTNFQNNSPALNFLKKQDQANTNGLGLSK